jgi:hypothetical protein
MSRPVPAAPSPGASAKRAKLTDADRERISEREEAKRDDGLSYPERVGISRRFTRGNQDWALLANGHYWVFRAGNIEPGALVQVLYGKLSGRHGVVTALIPTWSDQVVACVKFQWTKVDYYDKEAGKMRTARIHPGPFWRLDELTVVKKAR